MRSKENQIRRHYTLRYIIQNTYIVQKHGFITNLTEQRLAKTPQNELGLT